MSLPETSREVFQCFESRTNLERTTPQLRLYRLERMETLLERLENPQRNRPVVHLAGSKGKGSTAAYLSSLIAATGRTVGLYTSPHIVGYSERFRVIPPGAVVGSPEVEQTGPLWESALVQQGRRIWAEVEAMIGEGHGEDDLPTTFELLTALAFCFFPAVGCDWLVLETGLGGRLDATNVCRPESTLITRIEREHTEYLGETIPEIAGEKAGIIKTGAPLFLAPQRPEAAEVFRKTARDRDVPVVDVPPLEGSTAAVKLPSWTGGGTVRLGMLGEVHRTNSALALAAVRDLMDRDRLPVPSMQQVRTAVADTRLPGRGERRGELILDGAHTEESAENIRAAVESLLPPGTRIPVILGVVAGKNVEGIGRALAPIAAVFLVSRPGRFKPGDPQEVLSRLQAVGLEAELELEPATALERARRERENDNAPILVSGSFYMVAEIRRLVVP